MLVFFGVNREMKRYKITFENFYPNVHQISKQVTFSQKKLDKNEKVSTIAETVKYICNRKSFNNNIHFRLSIVINIF